MSSPSSIRTPLSPSVSYATTTALPCLTKNQSRYTDTTNKSSKATTYQMVSGAYPTIPTNHKRTPCSPKNTKRPRSMASCSRLQSKYQHFPRGHRTKFFRHLAQSYTQSHSPVLATFPCRRQRPSQPTTTTSPQTIHRRDTTNSHPHTNSHHLRSDSRSKTTNRQLLHDLTGRFPIQSNRGANYIFVLYDYDSNAILVRPLRN